VDEVQRGLAGLLAPKVCSTRLTRLLAHEVTQPALRMPLAYALAWLRVAGGNSVLPPWVALQFPETRRLIRELRDTPCGDPACGYCAEQHDPLRELHRHFGLTSFRVEPAAPDGGSLQEAIVRAGMRSEHLLAILPTGAGKSLCYQLPALSRFWRTGQLTVIISPLQSLMKDQVDGLVRQGIFSGAALNGLLSMPERKDVLDRIRLGDIGILLVSPEQLRSRGFVEAIRYRDVAAWVFDEAHCLSKWGHDFRPDYLYAARFIRERHPYELPQIACFTATAKLDVIADLEAHFAEVLGIGLRRFSGGHERVNLHFECCRCASRTSWCTSSSCWPARSAVRKAAPSCHRAAQERRDDRGVPARQRLAVQPFPRRAHAGGEEARPARLHRRRPARDRGHQRLRHGGGQAGRAPGGACRDSGIAGELPAGGRPGRPRPAQCPLRAALRRGGR
jgi:ATP-dependent DNA helicase RecQ